MRDYYSSKTKTPCIKCEKSAFILVRELEPAKGVIGSCGVDGHDMFHNKIDLRKRGWCRDFKERK